MIRVQYICSTHPPTFPATTEDWCDPGTGKLPAIIVPFGRRGIPELEQAGWLYIKAGNRFAPTGPAWVCPECAARYWKGPLFARAHHDFEPQTWFGIKFYDLGTDRLLCKIFGRYPSAGSWDSAYFELVDCFRPVEEGYRFHDGDVLKTRTIVDCQAGDRLVVGQILSLLNIEVVQS